MGSDTADLRAGSIAPRLICSSCGCTSSGTAARDTVRGSLTALAASCRKSSGPFRE